LVYLLRLVTLCNENCLLYNLIIFSHILWFSSVVPDLQNLGNVPKHTCLEVSDILSKTLISWFTCV